MKSGQHRTASHAQSSNDMRNAKMASWKSERSKMIKLLDVLHCLVDLCSVLASENSFENFRQTLYCFFKSVHQSLSKTLCQKKC